MVSIFHRLIDQLNSSVFVLLGILACTGWMLYKIGKWTAIFKHHDEKIVKIEGLAEKVVVMGTKVDLIYQLVKPPFCPTCIFCPYMNFYLDHLQSTLREIQVLPLPSQL